MLERVMRRLAARAGDPEPGFGAYFAYPSDTGTNERDGEAEKFIAGVQVIDTAKAAPSQ